jgi:hypothetical protein
MIKYIVDKIKIAPAYTAEYIETERPQPLADLYLEQLQQDILAGRLNPDISDQVYTDFKCEMTNWLFRGQLNTLSGFDVFDRVDIINGCTQFIDSIYMKGPVQVLKGDYRYHHRLDPSMVYSVPGYLRPGLPLIIAMPFPSTGDVHVDMKDILDEAQDKGISVNVDGAWLTCCRGIDFDISHPSIRSVGISLSKGLGLGWNRIGLRWTKDTNSDAVTIMNDFRMNLRAPVMIGLHYLRNVGPDYLWNTHSNHYNKVCQDFNLTPTNSVYLALRNGHPVGISPLIRYLEQHGTN